MASLQAGFISAVLRTFRIKSLLAKSLLKPPRKKGPLVPNHIKKNYLVSEQTIQGKTVATIKPKQGHSSLHLVFLHGGAYVVEGAPMHWSIIKKLIKKLQCTVSYIDYPLAPESTYRDTFKMLDEAYHQLTRQHPDDYFSLIGDSAGGGLALAFAQKLHADNAPIQPLKTVLFSPWLDITLNNPEINEIAHKDLVLDTATLKNCGHRYAGGDNREQNLLSPINGNLSGLGDVAVFYGSEELLWADCRKLEKKADNIKCNFVFFEYPDMQHDWILLPIPETQQAIDEACFFLQTS
jgi:monoterpene epsilon-lactone hydrolase